MPGKAKTPAPIDRPISRAYLRQFGGWSTAYPPGVSDPTTLRLMENVQVNRDGSLRIRPGLKFLSYDNPSDGAPWSGHLGLVGTHETFFMNDGSKALVFAARTNDVEERVTLWVAKYDPADATTPYEVMSLSEAGFEMPAVPADVQFTAATTYVKYVQIDNKILCLSNAGENAILLYVGETKKAVKLEALPGPIPSTSGGPVQAPPPGMEPTDPTTTSGAGATGVTIVAPNQALILTNTGDAAVPTANTLVASDEYDTTKNTYAMAVFATFSNEIGESEATPISTIRMQRPWSGWKWQKPNVNSEPDPAQPTDDPNLCADQFIVFIDGSQYDANVAAGATHINVYVTTWSNQDPMPVDAVLVARRELTGLPAGTGGDITAYGNWVRITPSIPNNTVSVPMPTAENRRNWSVPPTAGQGLVAADRLVLVYDPVNPAVVKWTSNQQGRYLDHSAARGGGYKTLTSGNMQIPACVKLWQNPQSTDTLTILTVGEDGHSTGYYMQPAQVAQQSEAVNIMGFEETTATPGTTSPFGVEVANNALYHPQDHQLMKSTASNYNINHTEVSTNIADRWVALANKAKIVSCLFDNRIYYLVHNPDGAALETHANGNEVWVLDIQAKTPTWSRWLVQGVSLRTIEVGGRIYMSIVRPDGIYYFDPESSVDEYVDTAPAPDIIATRAIPWKFEMNTQGANRAHDAWCHLHQLQINVGFFQGQLEYGVRGIDRLGQLVDKSKIVRDSDAPGTEAWDFEDYLEVKRDMKEWFFYANSVEVGGVVQPSAGQVSLVQYRYTPISVNVGYAYGSVETFEYGMADNAAADRTTVNGIPMPYVDTRRP